MARDIEQSLYQNLINTSFSFVARGVQSIGDIYNYVSNEYPDLCDNTYYCNVNCKSGNDQPEWNHTVRNALQKLKKQNQNVRFTGRRGYWEFY